MSLFSQAQTNRFYDPWESTPEERRRSFIAETIDQYIRYAYENIPFYRERLSTYEKSATHPLHRVPVLTSDDLRTLVPPQGDSLIVGGSTEYTVFQSGGTTAMPKTTLFSHSELEKLNGPNARGFFAVGLKASDHVANLFAVGGLYMTFIHINRFLQQYGCMNFPFSNQTSTDFIHTVTKHFQINCFTGIASVILNAVRDLAHLSRNTIQIDKVYYGGEHMYEADKREIRERCGASLILAPGYGTVDSWYLGYQCTDCPTGIFHAHDDEVYLEIVNEDSGKHCDFGEPGMLYATAYLRRLTPIVRYRVGDRAKWLKESCMCRRTTPLFKLLGRGDDILRIGYDSVDYNAVQEAVLKVPGLSGTIQMQKERHQGKDRLILRVETELAPAEHENKKEELLNTLLNSRPSLRDFVKKGTVWPIVIELLPHQSLPRNPRTGKLIRVIDSQGDE